MITATHIASPPASLTAASSGPTGTDLHEDVAIFVRLREQADLAPLAHLPRGKDLRVAAWDTIRAVAERTQPGILAQLEKWKTAGAVQSFAGWALGNTIEITSDGEHWADVFDGLVATGAADTVAAYDRSRMLRSTGPDAPRTPGAPSPGPSLHELQRGAKDPSTGWFDAHGSVWSAVQTGVDQVWAAGITGAGVRVGVLDRGVDPQHPYLRHALGATSDPERWTGTSARFAPDARHGTHVAGTVAGRDPAGAANVGMAPDAELIVASLADGALGALQSLLAPGSGPVGSGAAGDAAKGVDIINSSWSVPREPWAHARKFDVPLNQLHDAGIVLVFGADNTGPDQDTLGPIAAHPDVIAVAATTRNGTIATFSGRGAPGGRKPDIAAPGDRIPSASAGSGSWELQNGTSMATAAVSGDIALLLDEFPELMPDQVRHVLQASAIDMGPDGFDTAYGAGRIDMPAARREAARLLGR